MRRAVARVSLVAAVLALLGGCATAGKDAVDQGSEFTFVSPGGQTKIHYPPAERQKLANLAGESLTEQGKQIGLQNFQGKVVVLNLWGSWCGPCRSEADDLQAVQDQLGPQGVQVLGIDVRDSRSAAQDFHRDRGLTYPSIYDQAGRSLLALRGYPRSAVPSTIVLDRQHRVAAVFLTEMLQSELVPEVRAIASEPPA